MAFKFSKAEGRSGERLMAVNCLSLKVTCTTSAHIGQHQPLGPALLQGRPGSIEKHRECREHRLILHCQINEVFPDHFSIPQHLTILSHFIFPYSIYHHPTHYTPVFFICHVSVFFTTTWALGKWRLLSMSLMVVPPASRTVPGT
jgi:hypothetical protein